MKSKQDADLTPAATVATSPSSHHAPTMAASNAVAATIEVKAALNDEIRRFDISATSSIQDLRAKLASLFGIPSQFAIKYKDTDGDLITMSTDEEFSYATRKLPDGIIRVFISSSSAPSASAATAPVSMLAPLAPSAPIAPAAPSAPAPASAVAAQPYRPPMMMQDKQLRRQWKLEQQAARQAMKEQAKAERQKAKEEAMAARLETKKANSKNIGRFVKHVSIEDGTEMAPGTPFVKTWRFRNEGDKPWPQHTELVFVGKQGDRMSGPESVVVPGEGEVQPGQEVDVSVSLVAPQEPGRYIGYWRLRTPDGKKFGQRVWVQIQVISSSSSSSEAELAASEDSNSGKDKKEKKKKGLKKEKIIKFSELLKQLDEMGFVDKGKNVRLLNKFNGDIDQVVHKLLKQQQREKNRAKSTTTNATNASSPIVSPIPSVYPSAPTLPSDAAFQ
eukprot:GEZU01006916.1.p1 GENE.GEZU01006916.1~~GEZU01006916.1.p1  ORF type:complete len:446 (+),score=165.10 GEZU01006916.1:205-1542(+)